MKYDGPKDFLEQTAHDHGNLLGYAVIGALLSFLWIPIGVVSFMSLAKNEVLSFPPKELSLKWYGVFFADPQAMEAMATTVKIAVVVAPVCVVLAVLISFVVYRYDFLGGDVLRLLSTLPLIIPLIVVGIALTMFFGITGIQTGYWTIVAAHIIEALPFATLVILPTFYSFDRRLEEASLDLGADEVETFFFVTLPNIMPGVIAGGLLAFTISFNEFVYTFFVKNTATNTLPLFIWAKLKHRATPEVNVISVFFLLVAVTLLVLAITLTHVNRIAVRE